MELPVCRVRQIVATVTERRTSLLARDRVHLEWQTKALCSFIAQTVQSTRGARSLLREVERLTLFPSVKPAQERPVVSADGPEVVRAGVAPDPGSQAAAARPGSYERLTAGFGGSG